MYFVIILSFISHYFQCFAAGELTQRHEVFGQGSYGYTPLHEACYLGHEDAGLPRGSTRLDNPLT